MPDWLGPQRTEAACDRILDAAGALFADRGVESVAMFDIARAAGCSRATLYRYFENRDALHTAYVHRHARAVNSRLGELVGGIDEPPERLLAALTHALRLVRENPALSAWFTRTAIGAEVAERSNVVQALTAGFLLSVDPGQGSAAQRQARWLVRVLTSFLTVPGRDPAEERAMLEDFVVPLIVPLRTAKPVPRDGRIR
jgi:AcrR family transcriptional regulator